MIPFEMLEPTSLNEALSLLDPQEPTLVAGGKVPPVGDARPWLADPESEWGTLTVAPNPADPGTLIRTRIETELGDYRGYYANVRDAINGKAPLEVQSEDAYRVIRLLEMARESSDEERTFLVSF